MNDILKEKYAVQRKHLNDAISRLGEVLAMELDDEHTVRDSAIQRFEFCFDLSWKTLKTNLQLHHGISCASPKLCLKEATTVGLLQETDEFWLTMLELRNLTTHTYNEELATEIYEQLPAAHKHFLTLANRLQQ